MMIFRVKIVFMYVVVVITMHSSAQTNEVKEIMFFSLLRLYMQVRGVAYPYGV